MSASRVWLRQAGSDLRAARYLAQQDAEDFYCQTAAKCQQVVEKSVKAIAAELNNRRIVTLTIGFSHSIDQYISAINHRPHDTAEKKSVPDHIVKALRRNRSEVNVLAQL